MAGSDAEMAGVKREPVDMESVQRKKFKTSELPLSATQHAAIDNLLFSFKKKGGFDSVRKKVWAEYNEDVSPTYFQWLQYHLHILSLTYTFARCSGSQEYLYKFID